MKRDGYMFVCLLYKMSVSSMRWDIQRFISFFREMKQTQSIVTADWSDVNCEWFIDLIWYSFNEIDLIMLAYK